MKNLVRRKKDLIAGAVIAVFMLIAGVVMLTTSRTDSSRVAAAAIRSASPAAMTEQGKLIAEGEASFYGAGFEGRPTASGERFDGDALTAAHKTLPFGSRLRVTNVENGKSIIVRVNDRGPYAEDRVLDVSEKAAGALDMAEAGTANVRIELLPAS